MLSSSIPINAESHDPKLIDYFSQLQNLLPIIQIFGVSAILVTISGFTALRWQKNQEKAKIRRSILKEYQESFKDFVILLDTFMAKLVLHYKTFDQKLSTLELSNTLPYGYRDVDPESESEWKKINKKLLVGEDDQNSTELPQINRTNSYLDLPAEHPLNVEVLFKQFETFKDDFFKRRADVTKFLSSLRLYYAKSNELEIEFNVIWMILMANHMIINKIMGEASDKFKSLLDDYNSNAKVVFAQMKEFEQKLGQERIRIN